MGVVFDRESSGPISSLKSETSYQLLFQHMLDGYAYCRMVFDKDAKPEDFIYLDVNDAFEKHTGLKREVVIGKRVTEVIPGLKAQNPEIFQIYGDVVISGKPMEFETFIKPLEIWLRISVYTPGKDHFVAVFENITERKKAEEKSVLEGFRLQSLVNILQDDSISTQKFLDHALAEAIKITASKIGYIYFYDADTKEFVLNTWSEEAMQECTVQKKQTVYQLDKTGIWGEVVRQNKPIVVNDFQAPNQLKKGYPDGHVKLFRFLTVPIHKDDRIVAVAGVANKAADYTETDVLQLTVLLDSVWKTVEVKDAEGTLKASETRYRRLFETAKDGILILDASTGNIVDVNPYLVQILGFPKENFLNKAIWDLGFFKDIVSNKAKFEELQNQKYVHYEDLPLETVDGQKIDVEFVSNVYEVDHHKVIQCNIRNITERKKVEIALAESRERLDMALEAAKMGTFEWDIVNDKRTWDINVHQLLGTKPETFGGSTQDFLRVLHPEDKCKVQIALAKALETSVYDAEYRAVWTDGSIHHVSVRGKVHFNNLGKPIKMVAIGWDITESKEAEEALVTAKENLEEQVRERTAELRHLSQRLVETQEDERRLISMELHDEVGQELTILKMTLDMMSKRPAMMNQSDLKRASEQVSKVIGQVRNISMQLHPSSLEVLGLKPTLEMLFERLNTNSKLQVEFSCDIDDSHLVRDARLAIYRIIQEALTNVMRYSEVTKAQVTLKCVGSHISVIVQDKGKGFNPAILDSHKSAGISGMKERVRTLGGSFSIESAIGKGTIVNVQIPH